MHKIDLETLSEERLIQSVNSEILQLGSELFQKGLARVIELSDLSAKCTVHDKRHYHVQFKIEKNYSGLIRTSFRNNSNADPGNYHLFLKCSCSHASRGLICEHDVAAWLAIREKLIENIPPIWQKQIEQIVLSTNGRNPKTQQPGYSLFFSLQKDPATGSLTWRIVPLILPINAALKGTPQEAGVPNQWQSFFQSHPETIPRLRFPYQPLDAEACQNSSPEAVRLANLMQERRRISGSSSGYPLDDILPLIRNAKGMVFLGSSDFPILRSVELAPDAAEIQLTIDRDDSGLQIYPLLTIQHQVREIDITDIQVILADPTWIMSKDLLFELNHPSSLDIFKNFHQSKKLIIPAEQATDFSDQYLLDLARQIPLGGNAISWEEIDADPIPRLYLNELNGELLFQLRFLYQDIEAPYRSDLPAQSLRQKPGTFTLARIKRKPDKEQGFHDLLSSSGFGLKRAPLPAKSGHFRLRARTHPIDFLLNVLPRLAKEGFEIYGEEKLKTARVNRNTPSISFRVSSGIDWFDVQTVISFGDLEVPMEEMRRLVRKHERYVKLSDGSIGEIPEEWLDRYRHLFAVGNLQEDRLRFSKHHLTLIDQAIADADRTELDLEFENRRNHMRNMLNSQFKGIAPINIPDSFIGELRPYQKAGFDWLHFLHEYEFGGCLADDMGLGKTIQTLVFLQSLYHQETDPAPMLPASLLVVPRSLLVNWQRESARFTPELKIFEFFESDRVKDLETFNSKDLVITTYGVMLRDIQLLHGYEFYYAILDESQSIKNPLSQTARAAHLLQSRHRLVLTGTPIENSISELWSQFNFLNPGLLGNLKYFRNEFGLPIEKKRDEQSAQKLRRIVFPFIMRRTKDQVAPELPPRTERILYCDMEPSQRKQYNKTRDLYRSILMGMVDTQGLNESRMKILEGLLRLRQISNHPKLVDEKYSGTSGKFEFLIETLETLKAEDHKVLIFSQFVQMLNLVRGAVDEKGYPYSYLDGQTQARQDQVDAFQSDLSIPFFLISLKAGGLGLNLTAADYVIHIDPWWNPAVEMQASDRTHRIGQEKPVFVFKLITRDSVEEKILLLQERKRNLVDQIITTESSFFKELTIEDIKILFS